MGKKKYERKHPASMKRRLAKLRGDKCQLCGYESHTDLHHIIHVADGGDNSDENLILLCPNHHRDAHAGIYSIAELFEENGVL